MVYISFKFWFPAMCWITFLPIVCLLNSSSNKPDVCDVWKSSDNANYSYFLEISVEQGYYFCSGVLVEQDWVLMSYSCFLRIANFVADPLTKQSSPTPNLQSFFKNTNCFNIQQDTQIYVKSVAGNCVNGTNGDIQFGFYTVPIFGVIYDDYYVKNIDFIDNFFINKNKNNNNNSCSSSSNAQNARNVSVHVNDLVLLKLRDKFFDVPVELVKRSPFNYTNQDIDYEIYLQVQLEGNQQLIFGQTNVISENKNNNFECSKKFQNVVCDQNKQDCTSQTYVCGKFKLPDLGLIYTYQLQSGDPLVRKQDSMNAEIFGFFTTDFIPSSCRKYYERISKQFYSHKFGDYSLDSNGAVFVSFTEKNLNWINNIPNLYDEDRCKDIIEQPEEIQPPEETGEDEWWKNIVIIVCAVVICSMVLVTIFLYVRWKLKSGNRDEIEGVGLVGMVSQRTNGRNEDVSPDELEGMRRYGTIGENRCHRVYCDGRLPNQVPKIDILEKLREIQCLGNGAFGEVWSAEWQENQGQYWDGQKVAVKILMFQETVRTFDDFKQEIELMNSLNQFNSPYVPRFYGADNSIKGPAIVMELMEGGCLYKLLNSDDYNSNTFNLEWQLTLFLNIANGLQFLHQNNIVHQDLKPANILLPQDLRSSSAKICDFGFARTNPIRPSSVRGTYQYMAPEQQDKDPRNVAQKCDIYAFGVIMEEVVMGTQRGQEDAPTNPTNSSVINFLGNVFNFNRDRQVQLPPGYPNALKELIENCQLHNQHRRPNAGEVIERLEKMLQNGQQQV